MCLTKLTLRLLYLVNGQIYSSHRFILRVRDLDSRKDGGCFLGNAGHQTGGRTPRQEGGIIIIRMRG